MAILTLHPSHDIGQARHDLHFRKVFVRLLHLGFAIETWPPYQKRR